MHREDKSRFLLYIEPKAEQKSKEPLNDEITITVERIFSKAKRGTADYSNLESNGNFREGNGWKGWHTVDCGEHSDGHDYLLGNGMITNNLCVFYLRYYRGAIPKTEMDKITELCAWAEHNGA
jgi:hypothetical protein